MSEPRRSRSSRSLSPPKIKNDTSRGSSNCDRCNQGESGSDKKRKKESSAIKAQQSSRSQEQQQQSKQEARYTNGTRRNSAPRPYNPSETNGRNVRQANLVYSKHEKEKFKMQSTIDRLQEAFCEKESKLQDARSQLVRERRMSEIMERQLKNSRNLSEQLGRIIHEREQEIRTLKNSLNKKQDSRSLADVQQPLKANSRLADRRKSNSRDDFQSGIRRSSSTSEHSECNTLSSASVDKMLKEVHSLVEGLKIKDEAIKGLQEECTRRLDKIQTLQRNLQMLQDKVTHSAQHHSNVCAEKDAVIAQLQHALKEMEATVESLMTEKTKVVQEGESTINELQEIITQNELTIQKMHIQLEEALESKENEVVQLRSNIDRQQEELETKQRTLEDVSEELYSSQMEAETLKMELGQEKCSLNKMSQEINSLVEKLTRAVAEMETTKVEYQKKDDKLRKTQNYIKELYMSFFGDYPLMDKIRLLCKGKRETMGRKVLSEDDILPTNVRLDYRGQHSYFDGRRKSTVVEMANSQFHKQQLAELQQQVTESQTVCGILQEQLKEVTDFLDQLLHVEISPKNLSALSVIRQYGKHLPSPANMLSISKERIAPEGVSSNSQIDIESSKKTSDISRRRYAPTNYHQSGGSRYTNEARHGSCDNLKYYENNDDDTINNVGAIRSISAEDVQQHQAQLHAQCSDWDQVEFTEHQADSASDSDEILLLINDRNLSNAETEQNKLTKGARSPSPTFPHGLVVVKENYGSTGSINTRDKENYPSLERSASFGSFSGSVLMSYDQSEKASNEDSGLMRSRCVRSIDMMDIIQVGQPGAVGIGLSSDTDIWSEPDMSLSRQRMGLFENEADASSNEESTPVSDSSLSYHRRRKHGVQLKGDSPKKNGRGFWHHPVRKYASKLKRWLDRLKCYLHVFEDASFNLTDELNNMCQVRTDLLGVLSSTTANQRIDGLDILLADVSEYIRLNYILQDKVEKTIHYNRQLIDASGKNVSRHENPQVDEASVATLTRKSTAISSAQDKRQTLPQTPKSSTPLVLPPTPVFDDRMDDASYTPSDIHTQLVGYHSTLLSCQDMIKDLHSQLKERHCSELMNKHELNRTVYGYLEDIDTCIEELCKKIETGEDGQDPKQDGDQTYEDASGRRTPYSNFSSVLMAKLKENEDRLLRFESLLNHKEQELKMSAVNAVQLEVQLNSIKQSLYEIQMENLELKECLEFSENKQLEIEDSSNQMLSDLQMTMQRLSDLEERFRCIDAMTEDMKSDEEQDDVEFEEGEVAVDASAYPVEYEYHENGEWQVEDDIVPPPDEENYTTRDWENQDY